MANGNKVETLLTARDQASGTIQRFKGELQRLDKAARTAGQGLGAIAGGIALGAALAGIQQLGSAIVDLAQGAARLETLRNSFDGLAAGVGQSSADMLEALRQASRGMISDADLLLSANKAMLLGVADSADEMTALMQIAMQRGAAMGLSTTQAFNDIVTGLGRGSALILDNLGIVVDAEANNEAYAASIGKVASALNEQEKKQALINAVMREAAGAAGDATSSLSESARSIASMGAAWQNLRDQLGTLVSPAVATAMQGLADALNGINSAIDTNKTITAERDLFALGDSITGLAERMRALQAAQPFAETLGTFDASQMSNEIEMVSAALANVGAQYNDAARVTGAPLLDLDALQAGEVALLGDAQASAEVGAASAGAAPKVGELSAAIRAQVSEAEAATRAIAGLTGQIQSFFRSNLGALGLQTAIAGSEELTRKATAYAEVLRAQGLTSEQVYLSQQQYINGLLEPYQNQLEAIEENERATKSYGNAAAAAYKDAQSAYDSFVGRVQGVLQGGLSLDGINVDDMLPREDAINENARRLAAIANEGLIGQDWLEQFKSQVPDIYQALVDSGDPKTAAAQLLRDFQDGLVPDLLDKEKAKDLVKRAMTGEANMAALAQEIAAELAQEMGTSLQQAQAAAYSALGVKAPDGAGGIGDAAAAELNNEQTLQGMARAGVEAAATWGAAFLDRVAQGVPGQLIEMLTTLITPQVQAKLQAAQTQTGAQ